MPTKTLSRFVTIASIFVLSFLWIGITSVRSSPTNLANSTLTPTRYPIPAIQLTMWQQGESNWCGPGVLQSAIQWVNTYHDATPTPEPTMITRANLWEFMKNNTCSDISATGRDQALPGTVGDGLTDVRKLNIAYDVGVDPHALAWTMWKNTPPKYNYHYWIYSSSADESTRWALYTLEKYHEPVPVAIQNGFHLVLIYGYEAEKRAFPRAGEIVSIRVFDPARGTKWDYTYQEWISIWFTPYTDPGDPDPSTGWYVPPPDHWRNHWVTIERDDWSENPDWGMSLSGPIQHNPISVYLPFVNNSPEAVR